MAVLSPADLQQTCTETGVWISKDLLPCIQELPCHCRPTFHLQPLIIHTILITSQHLPLLHCPFSFCCMSWSCSGKGNSSCTEKSNHLVNPINPTKPEIPTDPDNSQSTMCCRKAIIKESINTYKS